MQNHTVTRYETIYTSSVRPDVSSTDQRDIPVLEWADAHPIAYDVVTKKKSGVWRPGSSTYLGCSSGETSSAILFRLRTLKHYVDEHVAQGLVGRDNIFCWRARFSLEHFNDKGFKGGFFQEFDGKYPRGCIDLDYTPETKEEALDRFHAWCRSGYDYGAKELWIDKKVARKLVGTLASTLIARPNVR